MWEKKRPTGNLMGSVHVHTVSLNSLHLYLKNQNTNNRKPRRDHVHLAILFNQGTIKHTDWPRYLFTPPPPRNDREEKEERHWQRRFEQVGITNNMKAMFNMLKWQQNFQENLWYLEVFSLYPSLLEIEGQKELWNIAILSWKPQSQNKNKYIEWGLFWNT